MESFSFDVSFSVPVEEVFAAFWHLTDWPEVAPHVRKIDLHYDDEEVQILTMHVHTKGRMDRFRSVRVRQGDSIFFFQPRPPSVLRRHYGWWHVRSNGGSAQSCVVTSEHTVEVDLEETRRFLETTGASVESDREATEGLAEVIRNNSRQTMEALRRRLEGGEARLREETS